MKTNERLLLYRCLSEPGKAKVLAKKEGLNSNHFSSDWSRQLFNALLEPPSSNTSLFNEEWFINHCIKIGVIQSHHGGLDEVYELFSKIREEDNFNKSNIPDAKLVKRIKTGPSSPESLKAHH